MFDFYQGDDVTLEQTFVDDDDVVIDITSIDIAMTVRNPKTKEVILTKSSAHTDEIEKTDPTNGVCNIYFSAAETGAMKGTYEYDIQLTLAGNVISTVSNDFLMVLEDVTA